MPNGVQVHSTGANNPYLKRYVQPDDGRLGKNIYGNSHNRPGGDVCASAYIGKMADGTPAIYQTLPWEKRCWLSGSGKNGNANKLGFIGFEICEDNLKDELYFRDAVLGLAVDFTAYICLQFNIEPDRVMPGTMARRVSDHAELWAAGLASNHGDITSWLKKYKYTMQDYRSLVKRAMEEGVEADIVDCDRETKMEYIFAVRYDRFAGNPDTTYLNLRSGPGTGYKSLFRIPAYTEMEVLDNSVSGWYKVDFCGVIGYVMAEFCSVLPETAKEEDYGGDSGLLEEDEDETRGLPQSTSLTAPSTEGALGTETTSLEDAVAGDYLVSRGEAEMLRKENETLRKENAALQKENAALRDVVNEMTSAIKSGIERMESALAEAEKRQ